jgi:hypothetical protein
VVVALVEEDSKGEEQDRGRGRAMRGVCPSRTWRRGGAGAAVGGARSRRQRGAEEQSRAPEEEEERGGSEGLVCKNRKSRDMEDIMNGCQLRRKTNSISHWATDFKDFEWSDISGC